MLGLLVQLVISWLIIFFVEKKDLGVLGLKPTKTRLGHFFLFFLITALCCSTGFITRMIFAGHVWRLNPNLTAASVWDGIWWNLRSVLFEELIFRGVLLFILIKRAGFVGGIIISAIAFGIYHWFSQNAFGSITNMIFLFLFTGSMGLVLAYGYAKTFSLYIPVGIHFGWNFTQQFIFASGPNGNQLFILTLPPSQVDVSFMLLFFIAFFPMVSALLINYLLLRSYVSRKDA